nr:hypothetical protein 11 [bacterium]
MALVGFFIWYNTMIDNRISMATYKQNILCRVIVPIIAIGAFLLNIAFVDVSIADNTDVLRAIRLLETTGGRSEAAAAYLAGEISYREFIALLESSEAVDSAASTSSSAQELGTMFPELSGNYTLVFVQMENLKEWVREEGSESKHQAIYDQVEDLMSKTLASGAQIKRLIESDTFVILIPTDAYEDGYKLRYALDELDHSIRSRTDWTSNYSVSQSLETTTIYIPGVQSNRVIELIGKRQDIVDWRKGSFLEERICPITVKQIDMFVLAKNALDELTKTKKVANSIYDSTPLLRDDSKRIALYVADAESALGEDDYGLAHKFLTAAYSRYKETRKILSSYREQEFDFSDRYELQRNWDEVGYHLQSTLLQILRKISPHQYEALMLIYELTEHAYTRSHFRVMDDAAYETLRDLLFDMVYPERIILGGNREETEFVRKYLALQLYFRSRIDVLWSPAKSPERFQNIHWRIQDELNPWGEENPLMKTEYALDARIATQSLFNAANKVRIEIPSHISDAEHHALMLCCTTMQRMANDLTTMVLNGDYPYSRIHSMMAELDIFGRFDSDVSKIYERLTHKSIGSLSDFRIASNALRRIHQSLSARNLLASDFGQSAEDIFSFVTGHDPQKITLLQRYGMWTDEYSSDYEVGDPAHREFVLHGTASISFSVKSYPNSSSEKPTVENAALLDREATIANKAHTFDLGSEARVFNVKGSHILIKKHVDGQLLCGRHGYLNHKKFTVITRHVLDAFGYALGKFHAATGYVLIGNISKPKEAYSNYIEEHAVLTLPWQSGVHHIRFTDYSRAQRADLALREVLFGNEAKAILSELNDRIGNMESIPEKDVINDIFMKGYQRGFNMQKTAFGRTSPLSIDLLQQIFNALEKAI